MRVLFHPQFPKDVRRFGLEYAAISNALAARFQSEVSLAVDAVKSSPNSAGHFLNISSKIVPELRGRNLRSFPFFILYGFDGERLFFGSLIASRSDPLTWLSRFPKHEI
jgi:hypothetical protein